jgi:hypothetical protein
LFATTVIGLGVLSLGSTEVSAQIAPVCPPGALCDHLKCYTVTGDRPVDKKFEKHVVDLFNQQFGDETCTLTDHARLFCAPTIKKAVDGQPPQPPSGGPVENDFICYTVSCKPTGQSHTFGAVDQFDRRNMKIGNARMLCVPAFKGPLFP